MNRTHRNGYRFPKPIDPLRAEIARGLYPRFLDFADESTKSKDNLPPYNLKSAAEDAVRAADHLIAALRIPAKRRHRK